MFNKHEFLQSHLRKPNKFTRKVLHPSDNKQSVPLASAIFNATTSAAIENYFPDRVDAANFLNVGGRSAIARQSIPLTFASEML